MILLNLLLATLMLHDPQGSTDVCNCAAAKLHGGWCQPHGVGYYAGLQFTSKELGETLDYHGHAVRADKTKCAACRKLIASGGYCDDCHMGFVNGNGYFSRLCYQIAKGTPVDPGAPRQPCCDETVKRKSGEGDANVGQWCAVCKRGIVGNRVYDDKPEFERTAQAVAIFKAAIAKSVTCNSCAIAMVADARCPTCKLTYRDGKPIPDTPHPGSPEPPSDGSPNKPAPPKSKPPSRNKPAESTPPGHD